MLLYVTGAVPSYVFVMLYAFWRISYNGFIGYLLRIQSNDHAVSKYLSRYLKEGSPWREYLNRELTKKMGPEYDFNVRLFRFARCFARFYTGIDAIYRSCRLSPRCTMRGSSSAASSTSS